MSSLSIETDVDNAQIQRVLVEGLMEILSAAVTQSVPVIRERAQLVIREAIQKSDEYDSILNGKLWHELGIVNPGRCLSAIIARIEESVEVAVLPFRHNGRELTSGGLRLQAVQANFEDILGLPEATFQSVSKRNGTVYDIDWLQWLLTGGGSVIIDDFHFVGRTRGSRTGYGVMAKSGTWAVPPEFAGTIQDNWLTRAMLTVIPVLTDIIFEEIVRHT